MCQKPGTAKTSAARTNLIRKPAIQSEHSSFCVVSGST
jgi:hypothetical protein